MFSMCSELTPRAHVPDNRIPQLMQPWKETIFFKFQQVALPASRRKQGDPMHSWGGLHLPYREVENDQALVDTFRRFHICYWIFQPTGLIFGESRSRCMLRKGRGWPGGCRWWRTHKPEWRGARTRLLFSLSGWTYEVLYLHFEVSYSYNPSFQS